MGFESLKSRKITSPKPRRFILKMSLPKKKKAKSDVFKIKNSLHRDWLYFSAEKYINLFFFFLLINTT